MHACPDAPIIVFDRCPVTLGVQRIHKEDMVT